MRVLFAVVVLAALTVASNLPNQIFNLPGAPELNFNQYAGYVNVDAKDNRNLFYWFVESQSNPSTDPIVLWLNGGPGCSSVGGGLLSENGPFWPAENGSLIMNPYAWNKVANVVYLESPAGVGFSFSDNTSNYVTGDVQTATDSYNFLVAFFDMYPSLQGRPFWITGESYGGHYVPELAGFVGHANNPKINLQGFMVGNAWTDPTFDNEGCVFDWWSHSLNSDATYNGLLQSCNFSNIGPLAETAADCNKYVNRAFHEMGNINIYDIYEYVCMRQPEQYKQGEWLLKTVSESGDSPAAVLARGLLREKPSSHGRDVPAPPCIDNFVQNYLNTLEVQEAIHANTTLGYQWTDCSPRVQYNYGDVLTSVLPLYESPAFKSPKMKILVYSGDVDAIVPTPGTKYWLELLDLNVKEAWRPWLVSNSQVGGYVIEYHELTFATVRDAGHMVPGTQPERAFHMFSHFLAGEPL